MIFELFQQHVLRKSKRKKDPVEKMFYNTKEWVRLGWFTLRIFFVVTALTIFVDMFQNTPIYVLHILM